MSFIMIYRFIHLVIRIIHSNIFSPFFLGVTNTGSYAAAVHEADSTANVPSFGVSQSVSQSSKSPHTPGKLSHANIK